MFKFLESIENSFATIFSGLVLTSVGFVTWLVRQVFTNQRKVEILQEHVELLHERHLEQFESLREDIVQRDLHRDQLRKEDRDDLAEVKTSVKRVENFLLEGKK